MALQIRVVVAVVEPGSPGPLVQVERADLTWNPSPEDREAEAQLANAALDSLGSEAIATAQGRLRDIMHAVVRKEQEDAERVRRVLEAGDQPPEGDQ